MKLAVIPARGGSVRIPGKNIKLFCGKPMIGWSIEAALESRCFDRVVVSTDDEEIASVAREYGAEVPFIRPPELSDDMTGTAPVVRHAVELLFHGKQIEGAVCCIYATAPFVRPEDIRQGLELLQAERCQFAFSVTSYPYPIQRALRIDKRGRTRMREERYISTRSQDLEECFHDAGQFYWGTSEAWMSGQEIFSSNTVPVILPRYRVQDIDTLEDWERAERMFLVDEQRWGGNDEC